MAVTAFVCLDMEIMAEYRIVNRPGFVLEGFCCQPPVTGATVGSCRKCSFAVVTDTARSALFHISHADTTTHRATLVTTLAAQSLAVYMGVVTEHGIANRNTVGDCRRGATVAFAAVFVSGYTECFFTIVAGSAGEALLHFCHTEGALF